MIDMNRPLHAYDANKISGKIIVRRSKKSEHFEALDNKKYELSAEDCVIADQSKVLGLGGIIGGVSTGTEMSTTDILLEAAASKRMSVVDISVPVETPPIIPPSPRTFD